MALTEPAAAPPADRPRRAAAGRRVPDAGDRVRARSVAGRSTRGRRPLDADGQGDPVRDVRVRGTGRAGRGRPGARAPSKVLRIVAAHDVGRAINPTQVEGQIHGGIAQGLGFALMEAYVPGRTENLHDYLIPTVGDMPEIECLLVEDAEPAGPVRREGSGGAGPRPDRARDPRRDPRRGRRPDHEAPRDAGPRAGGARARRARPAGFPATSRPRRRPRMTRYDPADRPRGRRRAERLRGPGRGAGRGRRRRRRPGRQPRDRGGTGGRGRRGLHAGLAPAAHAALRPGRRDLAGALRDGHVGRGAAPGPRPRRAGRPQGIGGRGRLLRVHDARPADRGVRRDRARGAAARARRRAGRRLRAGDGLLRVGDRARRRGASGSRRACCSRASAPWTSRRATASGPSGRCARPGSSSSRPGADRRPAAAGHGAARSPLRSRP